MDEIRSLVGTIVAGRYLVEDVIGAGGMAYVLRGRHATLGTPVAIKILKPPFADSPELSARFDREARAVSGFDHPNCRKVYDCGYTDDGLKFMAMQFLEGRELATVIGQRIPASQCVELLMQILRGLEHAHSHGVVHRDLKPDNIFVTRDHEDREVLKLVDFGIAKLVDDRGDGLTTRVGAVVGTPAYMSPEQALGADVDARADLYSLGIIGYELAVGRHPLEFATPKELMRAHVMGTTKPLPPHVPALLGAVLAKLMDKDRELRYRCAADALRALERVKTSLRTDPTPWISLLRDPPQRRGGTRRRRDTRARNLDAVDHALRNILASHTPIACAALRTGIRGTPVSSANDTPLHAGHPTDSPH
jgi:eukaryotic-like serine/threonine-protein kinase